MWDLRQRDAGGCNWIAWTIKLYPSPYTGPWNHSSHLKVSAVLLSLCRQRAEYDQKCFRRQQARGLEVCGWQPACIHMYIFNVFICYCVNSLPSYLIYFPSSDRHTHSFPVFSSFFPSPKDFHLVIAWSFSPLIHAQVCCDSVTSEFSQEMSQLCFICENSMFVMTDWVLFCTGLFLARGSRVPGTSLVCTGGRHEGGTGAGGRELAAPASASQS